MVVKIKKKNEIRAVIKGAVLKKDFISAWLLHSIKCISLIFLWEFQR